MKIIKINKDRYGDELFKEIFLKTETINSNDFEKLKSNDINEKIMYLDNIGIIIDIDKLNINTETTIMITLDSLLKYFRNNKKPMFKILITIIKNGIEKVIEIDLHIQTYKIYDNYINVINFTYDDIIYLYNINTIKPLKFESKLYQYRPSDKSIIVLECLYFDLYKIKGKQRELIQENQMTTSKVGNIIYDKILKEVTLKRIYNELISNDILNKEFTYQEFKIIIGYLNKESSKDSIYYTLDGSCKLCGNYSDGWDDD